MPGTHQQLLYHIVFSTKQRKPLLSDKARRDDTFAYMAGVARNLEGYALDIGGWTDHCHILVRIPAKISVSEFVGRVKATTSKHLNERSSSLSKFGWQEGFGAFSVSPSQQRFVSEYIRSQEEHHRTQSFEEEYLRILERHCVDYDPRYLWD